MRLSAALTLLVAPILVLPGNSPARIAMPVVASHNSGQPTIAVGAKGDVVKRLQRALRRTPNL